MPAITLPDQTIKTFESSVSIAEVAASIGPGLAKATVAGEVNGSLKDTSYLLESDCHLRIITLKDPEGLEVLRHSCAHLMAQAVKSLYPSAQVTIGPVIEDGFYYDFAYSRSFTLEDMHAIENKMLELAKLKQEIKRKVKSRSELIDLFEKIDENYKVQIIKQLPENEDLTIYEQSNFFDLCRGPHLPNTSFIKAFKLTKLAGAYWRGDSNNEMLQRIYGTAWPEKKQLNAYLDRIEQAKARDHRVLVKKMGICHFQDIAPGMVFWHGNGWTLFRTLCEHIRKKLVHDYQEVNTPNMVDIKLWEQSGHKAKFNDEMFQVFLKGSDNKPEQCYAIKPMNCPCHVQIFKNGLKSYRDLPIRLAEFGSCHRNEPSGTLHGLMRVRGFIQDDGHIFCTPEQIAEESSSFLDLLFDLYKDFGFSKENITIKLSTRPEQRVGSDQLWDKAEETLKDVLNKQSIQWDLLPGEGAFYGPKIEVSLTDCLDRVWQCGTLQLDFFMTERLDATYIAKDGSKQHPVMLHRAILGSIERFIGILLEHTAGRLPLWLAPVQVVVAGISNRHDDYVHQVSEKLQKMGIRAKYDLRNEKIGFKIREHAIARVPYLVVLGDQEQASGQITVRTDIGEQLSMDNLADFVVFLKNKIELKEGRSESLVKNV